MNAPDNIHAGQPVTVAGAPLDQAHTAVIMLHGRGASAQDILGLAPFLEGDGIAFLAPQAAGNAWYPFHFMTPLEGNEPALSSALATVGGLVAAIGEAGIPPERTLLLGFSQGACLALEYAARHPRRYAGIIGLSGGLIGPPDHVFAYPGSLEGTPVFLGCSDVDRHIPVARVHQSADVLAGLGAAVDKRIYPGMGHTVIPEEMDAVRAIMAGITVP